MPDRNRDAQAAGRLARARTALEGLSVGDAFGERFFVDYTIVEGLIEERAEPVAPWPYTDDTEMALSIVASLIEHGRIDQDYLAREFAGRYDPSRGYGPAMHRTLRRIGARDLAPSASVRLAVAALGNGTKVSAQDTVPFALWCAAHHLDDFVEAMWLTVSGLGDRDTTCAIVGGIVAGYTGSAGIPEDWRT